MVGNAHPTRKNVCNVGGYITWILHESEAFIGKATKGEVVVFYFDSLATQHMEASGSLEG